VSVTDGEIGAQRVGDRRGWLMFDHLPDDLARAEDQTQAADRQRVREHDLASWNFTRAATDTEKLLLEHLGYTLPANLTTHVVWLSPGVRNRAWPQLESPTTQENC
jgi:hypothetical protein